MKQKTNVRLLKFLLDPLIKKCANCSMCREECPTYMVKQNESFFAGGRLRLLRAFTERDYAIDQDFQTTMAFCTTCKQCEDRLPHFDGICRSSRRVTQRNGIQLASWIW